MSRTGEPVYRKFLCKSEYQECDECGVTFKPGETVQAMPPTDEPPEGWQNTRCFPNGEKAVEIREGPLPEVDLSPQTHTFRSRFINRCYLCR